MTITKENIMEWSKPHHGGGRQTIIKTPKVIISIVGGGGGLYGDFEKTFELAIMTHNGSFITRLFCPGLSDDVCGYMEENELIEVINSLTTRGFQIS